MMLQFRVIGDCLCVVDTSRYDAFYGFARVLRRLTW